MTKWTPGPWFSVNIGTDEEPMMDVKAARIAGQEPRHCVAICATGDSPQPMETANAHLIAAAPELYEALEDCLNWIDYMSLAGPATDTTKARIETALAKARGEQ